MGLAGGDTGRGLRARDGPAQRQEIGGHRAQQERRIVIDDRGGRSVTEEVHRINIAARTATK
jgi:hypothetical protein